MQPGKLRRAAVLLVFGATLFTATSGEGLICEGTPGALDYDRRAYSFVGTAVQFLDLDGRPVAQNAGGGIRDAVIHMVKFRVEKAWAGVEDRYAYVAVNPFEEGRCICHFKLGDTYLVSLREHEPGFVPWIGGCAEGVIGSGWGGPAERWMTEALAILGPPRIEFDRR
jgi:hypothetical protein